MTYETLDIEAADIESNRPNTSSSCVSSNMSIDCNTSESQDTPDATRLQYTREFVSNNNNLPAYSPVSQDNDEEPTNLTLAKFIEESFFEE